MTEAKENKYRLKHFFAAFSPSIDTISIRKYKTTSGQRIEAAGWVLGDFQRLERRLIIACETQDVALKQEALHALQDLECYIKLLDQNDYNEIIYATKSGSIDDFIVRSSLINSKGQNRFLKPKKSRGMDR